MINYYYIMFVLSVICTFIYICKWHKRYNVYFTIMFILFPIANMGRWQISISTSLNQAILGTYFEYMGGCFCTLAMMLCISYLCKYNLSKRIRCMMFACAFAIYAMVLTIGHSTIYYKGVDFGSKNGYSVLIKEYGIGHHFFYIMVFISFVFCFLALAHALKRRNEVSIRTIIMLLIIMSINAVIFFGGRRVVPQVELMPVGYVLDQICFLFIGHRYVLYDVERTVVDVAINKGDLAIISFDHSVRFLGCNSVALTYFPELSKLCLDRKKKMQSSFSNKIDNCIERVNRLDKPIETMYEADDKVYKIVAGYLMEGKKKRGYQFMIDDYTQEQNYINFINNYNEKLEAEVKEKTNNLVDMHNRMVLGMATMVENRDNSTGGHIKRTSEVVRILVNEMRQDEMLPMSEQFCSAIIKAAPMHDLGKIAVDDIILRKTGRFTPEEYEVMKTHANKGAEIVRKLLSDMDDEYFASIAENVAHYHHERVDGSGYPCGLKGDAIPFEARIMAIADVYDALVSKRCYKDSMSFEEANKIILDGMGTQFDEKLKCYYEACRPKLEGFYKKCQNGEQNDINSRR